MTYASRVCPRCATSEPILETEEVWPGGWTCRACGHAVPVSDGIPMFAPELADTVSGFDPSDFARLREVEDSHFWFVPRNRLLVGLLNRFFPQAQSFFEIGCGNGIVLAAVDRARRWKRLAGSDLHLTGLMGARTRLGGQAEFWQFDARKIPLACAFDVIGAFDVVEHIAEDEVVFAEMRRAVVEGGGVILTVPQHPWLWSHADEVAHHQRRYRRSELEAKLKRAEFEILFSTCYTFLLLPLMAASRMTHRSSTSPQRSNHTDMDYELNVLPAVNRALTVILNAEVTLTLAGVRWPIGGSRVVVARAV